VTATLAHIWRHPIKAHGVEPLDTVTLTAGKALPYDRAWAIQHEGTRMQGADWAPCANFSRGAKAPQLMAVRCKLDERTEQMTLTHPNRPDLVAHPDRDGPAIIDWVQPLMPADRARSTAVIRASTQAFTDSPFPSISIGNLATHRAVEAQLGQELALERWRANLWLDGLEPWEEFNWIGKTLHIGGAVLEVKERITRCLATTANPATGLRDADTLGALDHWSHRDFGIYATVTTSGDIATGDKAQLQ